MFDRLLDHPKAEAAVTLIGSIATLVLALSPDTLAGKVAAVVVGLVGAPVAVHATKKRKAQRKKVS